MKYHQRPMSVIYQWFYRSTTSDDAPLFTLFFISSLTYSHYSIDLFQRYCTLKLFFKFPPLTYVTHLQISFPSGSSLWSFTFSDLRHHIDLPSSLSFLQSHRLDHYLPSLTSFPVSPLTRCPIFSLFYFYRLKVPREVTDTLKLVQ